MKASEGGAELCRVHIAYGPTFRRQKKDFPEEGIQCPLRAERCHVPVLEGGEIPYEVTYGETSLPTLSSPDEDCAVLVPTWDFRLLI